MKSAKHHNVFFTADTHFSHRNIPVYANRLMFLNDQERELHAKGAKVHCSRETIERMNDYLINKINETVGENDELWHLGDFAFSRYDTNEVGRLRARINCKNIYLIWGNHDDRKIYKYFN